MRRRGPRTFIAETRMRISGAFGRDGLCQPGSGCVITPQGFPTPRPAAMLNASMRADASVALTARYSTAAESAAFDRHRCEVEQNLGASRRLLEWRAAPDQSSHHSIGLSMLQVAHVPPFRAEQLLGRASPSVLEIASPRVPCQASKVRYRFEISLAASGEPLRQSRLVTQWRAPRCGRRARAMRGASAPCRGRNPGAPGPRRHTRPQATISPRPASSRYPPPPPACMHACKHA